MSKEWKQHYKEPKKETTLARLTRQAKAISRLMTAHNKAVCREEGKLQTAIVRLRASGEQTQNAIIELENRQEAVEDLAVGYD